MLSLLMSWITVDCVVLTGSTSVTTCRLDSQFPSAEDASEVASEVVSQSGYTVLHQPIQSACVASNGRKEILLSRHVQVKRGWWLNMVYPTVRHGEMAKWHMAVSDVPHSGNGSQWMGNNSRDPVTLTGLNQPKRMD